MIQEIYLKTVALYEKTHHYHILSVNKDYNLHQETGKQYEELVSARDDLGEQILAIGLTLPKPVSVQANATTCQEMVKELYDYNEEMKKDLMTATETAPDKGTENILADRLNIHAKMCMKLKSLMEEMEEYEKEEVENSVYPVSKKLSRL